MPQRVFGPVQGAGTQVTERVGDQPIQAGQLGGAGYAAILDRGLVGELIQVSSPQQLRKVTGGLIPDSLGPDAAQHFFQLAAGAAPFLHLVRITDGTEEAAGGYKLFDRSARVANVFARRTTLTPIGNLHAKNGGTWGGAEQYYTDEFALVGDLTEVTLDTGITTFATDEWKGGWVELNAVTNKRYPIISSTDTGVITVAADQTMATDLAGSGSPTDFRYYLVIDRDPDRVLTWEVRDGDTDPNTTFKLIILVNGEEAVSWDTLSMDPNSAFYWVNVINEDGNNDEIWVEDLWTGARTADIRPASYYGEVDTVAATSLTIVLSEFAINSPTGADPTFALGTTTDDHLAQVITLTMTSPTAFDAESDRFGDLGSGTLGALFTPNNKWTPPFTVTAGGTALVATDELTVIYKPFRAGELVDGFLFPDKVNAPLSRFRITANDHDTITVALGSDLTADGDPGDEWLVEAPVYLQGGLDGIGDIDDTDYITAWDPNTSPFRRAFGRNLGLIKYATPGVTSTAVQKAGLSYAYAHNHQYRVEIPANIVTEDAALTYINETIGRSNYGKVSFPSYGDITAPDGGTSGKLKRVSLTGYIHGREAAIARDNQGYHKAAAGISATLDPVLRLPTGDAVLNEELLNPQGINVVKKKSGNFILWGDRTISVEPEWRFAHQRELLSYYELVFLEAFDFIIFGLNNTDSRATVNTSFQTFFLTEFGKGALDTDVPFPEAAVIKIDTENNPDIVKQAGDMVAELSLKLVGVIERLRIFVSKKGVFEGV